MSASGLANNHSGGAVTGSKIKIHIKTHLLLGGFTMARNHFPPNVDLCCCFLPKSGDFSTHFFVDFASESLGPWVFMCITDGRRGAAERGPEAAGTAVLGGAAAGLRGGVSQGPGATARHWHSTVGSGWQPHSRMFCQHPKDLSSVFFFLPFSRQSSLSDT